MGGPSLLRSQIALSDQHGELINPVIHGSLQSEGMPAVNISEQDGLAVAAYVRSVMETIGVQGTPPPTGGPDPNVLVGNAKEGQAYFNAKCASCHSATGDMKGIATRVGDARDLQTSWVRGGSRSSRRNARPGAPDPRAVTVTVVLPSGEHVEGRLLHVDDFLVTVQLADGSNRSFPRNGDRPAVEVHDPMKGHRDLLSQYTDRDIHDVTAYLETLQ